MQQRIINHASDKEKMFRDVLYHFRVRILVATLLSSISALAGIYMLSMISGIIGNFESGVVDADHSFQQFLGTVALILIAGMMSQYILIKLSSIVVFDIQNKLLGNILETKYETIEKHGGHKLIATLEDDVGSLADGILAIPILIYNTVTVALGFGYLFLVSHRLFLLVVIVIGIFLVLGLSILKLARVHQNSLREYTDSFYKNLKALANGGKELRLDSQRRNHYFQREMVPLFKGIRTRTVKSEVLFSILDNFTVTLFFLLIGVIVYGAPHIAGETDTAVIVTFVLVILYLINPISQIAELGEAKNKVDIAQNKISSLDLGQTVSPNHNLSDVLPFKVTEICIDSLTYQFKPELQTQEPAFELGPVTTNIQAGKITFITGGNGSGKSTFAKLLVGLYESDSGTISIDNQQLAIDFDAEAYRRNISAIFFDYFLFDQLLDSNGEPAKDDEVYGHMKTLDLAGKVTTANGLLLTTNLSTGQKKRLALLQSLLNDKLICVFDEVAADQDPTFKEYFYLEFLKLLRDKGKFVIVISHDENYFSCADHILRFEEGALSTT